MLEATGRDDDAAQAIAFEQPFRTTRAAPTFGYTLKSSIAPERGMHPIP